MKAKERHEIKTDKFLEIMMFVEDFVVRNGKMIAMAVGAVVLVIALVIGALWYLDARDNESATAFNLVLPEVSRLLTTDSPDAAAVEKVTTSLADIQKNHGGTAAAVQAQYYLGMVMLKQGNTEGALEQFSAVSNTGHHWFSSVAAAQIGEIYTAEGKYKEAADQFAAIVNRGNAANALAFYSWKAGDNYEKAGDKNQALLYYNKAKETPALGLDSALLGTIERRIQALGASPATAAN